MPELRLGAAVPYNNRVHLALLFTAGDAKR